MVENTSPIILAVDGDGAALETLTRAIEPLGHVVLSARSRKDGLRLFQDVLPRIVFLNATLEGRSTSRLCAEMKRTEHGLVTPIVVTSEDKSRNRLDVIKSHRAADYLTKPLSEAKVRTVVAWALAPPEADASAVPIADPLLDRFPGSQRTEGAVSLESGSLPYLLGRSEEDRMTGTLLVQRQQFRKALVLREGRIVGARSNAPADQLGRILLAMRLLTPGELDRAVARMSRDTDLFDCLHVLGLVRAEIRQQVLRYRAMSIGLSLFRWIEGSLQFLPGETLDCDRLEEPIRPLRLAALGLRSTPALLAAAGRRFLRDDVVFFKKNPRLLLAKNGEEFLTLQERNLATLADGARGVREIREVGRLARWDVDGALAVLAGTGLLQNYGATTPRKTAHEPASSSAVPAASDVEGEPVTTGSLEQLPFVEVLGALMRRRATGSLTVSGEHRRSFGLLEGEVVCAQSSCSDSSLGQVLLRERLVGVTVLQEALAQQRIAPGRRLGTLLVETGELTLATLSEALRRQILHIVETTFAWTGGTFEYVEKETAPEWTVGLAVPLTDLLRRGAAAVPDGALRRKWLPPGVETRLVLHEQALDRALFNAFEHKLRRVAAEGTPVRELLAVGQSQLHVLQTIQFWAAAGFAEAVAIETPVVLPATEEPREAAGPPRGEGTPEPGAGEANAEVAVASSPAADGFAAVSDPGELALMRLTGVLPAALAQASAQAYTSAQASWQGTAALGTDVTAVVAMMRDALHSEKEERRALEREVRALTAEVARLTERLRTAEEPAPATAPAPRRKTRAKEGTATGAKPARTRKRAPALRPSEPAGSPLSGRATRGRASKEEAALRLLVPLRETGDEAAVPEEEPVGVGS